MPIHRTCTVILEDDEDRISAKVSQSLDAHRSVPAYVLLGDPGAGKTTAFKSESATNDGHYITARDFLTFEVNSRTEWHGKTLFIDGLDEVRAGKPDVRVPFDEIRKRLNELEKPRFRLSCREADWLGENDCKNLAVVSPDNRIVVLRLDPLTNSDITHILQSHSSVEDAALFIEKARQVGVEGLLINPQSLNMLVAAVTGDHGWPSSRLETFESACREMAREHNDEHSVVDQAMSEGELANLDQLLDAAGRLCALMLISGAAGFTRHRNYENTDYPALDRCEYEHPGYLKAALSTNLFKALETESVGRFEPVHRHIAEFLSARHLCKIICGGHDRADRTGIPARRVISLLTGEDGMVVSEFRGLSAWLAAHCAKSRRQLIARDPTGVGLYGDIQRFSIQDKHQLIVALKHHVSGLENIYQAATAFSALSTPDMEPALRGILKDSNPTKEYQKFVDFVLCILGNGDQLSELSEVLFEIVRDNNRSPWVNRSALIAFVRNCPLRDKTGKLEFLLDEIESGKVPDSENEMLGMVLSQLYPERLPPSRIWDYLRESTRHIGGGMYDCFWRYDLLEQSSDDHVVSLLDGLVDRLPALYAVIKSRQVGNSVMDLLQRGLVTHGDAVSMNHLYGWLGIGNSDFKHLLRDMGDGRSGIRTWLEQRPHVCKAILLYGLKKCPDSDDFWIHAFDVEKRLYYATMPPDFGIWCLDQAVVMSDKKPRIAEFLWIKAIDAHRHQRNNEGLSLDLLEQYAHKNDAFAPRLEGLLNQQSVGMERSETHQIADELGLAVDWQFDGREKVLPERHKKAIEQRQQKERRWHDHICANVNALRENRAAPGLLFDLARIYFGPFFNFKSNDGPKTVKETFKNNTDLIDAVLVGLQRTVDRDDIPDVEEILHCYEAGKRYYIGLPCLASLAEKERTATEGAVQLSNDQARKVLAFYFTEAHGDYQPDWFKCLIADRPQTVADVYIRYVRSEYKLEPTSVQDIHNLSSNPGFSDVARIASIPLLKAFPTRCRSTQLEILKHLLTAAIRYAERSSLQSLIETKTSRTSMIVGQHALWLAAGLIVSSGKFNDRVECFIGEGRGRASRIYKIMMLLHPSAFENLRFPELCVAASKLLIRLVGRDVEPDVIFGTEDSDEDGESTGGRITYAMSASFFVRKMIDLMAADPNPEATDSLESLLVDDTLSDWHSMLESSLHTQRRIRRDVSYHRLTIEKIGQTLKGGTPANAGDLAALLMDRLSELAITIKDGNTDDWKQYWNLPHGQDPTPRNEDDCRDALLSDLRRCLPTEVDAQPEGQYTNDKRSDMRIAYSNFQVPVEVKKNSHRELWSAMHRQLIKKYVRDPATDGYGIYLVFWFGEEYTQAPPTRKRPDSPQELQVRLEATLSPDEARKISVCVIDVSSSRSQS
ncbi:MAG: hypothetical protein OXO51_02545 [Gemmatimonadota bacterium]|nr:hypothetical protein [Gemmatimonadota bacterium]